MSFPRVAQTGQATSNWTLLRRETNAKRFIFLPLYIPCRGPLPDTAKPQRKTHVVQWTTKKRRPHILARAQDGTKRSQMVDSTFKPAKSRHVKNTHTCTINITKQQTLIRTFHLEPRPARGKHLTPIANNQKKRGLVHAKKKPSRPGLASSLQYPSFAAKSRSRQFTPALS